jgi:hypothetical protein
MPSNIINKIKITEDIHALVYRGGRVQLVGRGVRLVVTDVYGDRQAGRFGVTVRPEPMGSEIDAAAGADGLGADDWGEGVAP